MPRSKGELLLFVLPFLFAGCEPISTSRVHARKAQAEASLKNPEAIHEQVAISLIEAAREGRIDVVRALLDRGDNVNETDKEGRTALMAAAEEDKAYIVLVLLNAGADVNMKDKEGKTALARTLSREAIYLFSNELSIWKRMGFRASSLDVINSLVTRGADVNTRGKSGLTTLMMAAMNARGDVVRALLNKGAEVNVADAEGRTALLWAAQRGSIDSVLALLNAGADVNAKTYNGSTALMDAAVFGYLDIVHALLNKSADVNATDEDGETALMGAIGFDIDTLRGHEVFLEKKSTLTATEREGLTQLLTSASTGNPEVVSTLLNAGADVDAKNKYGWTVLITAVQEDKANIARILIGRGATVNARDNLGVTALMWAALKGHIDSVRVLLNAGSDVNVVAEYGMTALKLAKREGKTEIVKLLRACLQTQKAATMSSCQPHAKYPMICGPSSSNSSRPPPSHAKGGRKRAEDRRLLDGMLYVLWTGCAWRALSRLEFGPWQTVYDRFAEWKTAGVFERIWARCLHLYDAKHGIDWEWQAADGTYVRAPLGGKSNRSQSHRPRQTRL